MSKKKYSHYEKRAYWMGYGAGLSGGDGSRLIDERRGQGQRKDLCQSARAGYADGKRNDMFVPFSFGHKRYPVKIKLKRSK